MIQYCLSASHRAAIDGHHRGDFHCRLDKTAQMSADTGVKVILRAATKTPGGSSKQGPFPHNVFPRLTKNLLFHFSHHLSIFIKSIFPGLEIMPSFDARILYPATTGREPENQISSKYRHIEDIKTSSLPKCPL